MLFPFIINKTKIVIIWLHCKWQYCLYSYQYSPSAGIKWKISVFLLFIKAEFNLQMQQNSD